MLTERLNRRQAEKAELEAQLAIENNKKICLTEAQIYAFLDFICEMSMDDVNKRRALINIFVHSVYLYDEHFTIIINASKKPLSIDNIPLDEIEEAFEGENEGKEGCSSMTTPAPPKEEDAPRCVLFFCWILGEPLRVGPDANSGSHFASKATGAGSREPRAKIFAEGEPPCNASMETPCRYHEKINPKARKPWGSYVFGNFAISPSGKSAKALRQIQPKGLPRTCRGR